MPNLASEPGIAMTFNRADLVHFHAIFKQLGINAARPWRFLNLAGLALRQEVALSYKTWRAPTGTPWPPLSPATLAARSRRKKRGRSHKRAARKPRAPKPKRPGIKLLAKGRKRAPQPLRDTGTMWRSITTKKMTVPPAVVVGYGDWKAPFHQQVGRAQRAIKGKQRVPVRKTLPEHWNYRLTKTCMAALQEQLKQGGVGRYLR